MTRIIYGVSGEGSGHSSRAREMARHLLSAGHEVRLASYGRGYANLADEFDLLEIEGLTIASSNNRVSVIKTVTENLQRLTSGGRRLKALRRLFDDFRPHCVITDFEPMTAYLASHLELPLITLDNQHRMRYLDYETPPGLDAERLVTEAIIRTLVPFPHVSLVTAFSCGEPKNDRTFVFPPIVRAEVRALRPTVGEHLLVYVTSGFDSLIDQLREFKRETCLVYGYDRDSNEGNLHFRPFSKAGFLTDLASAKAVVATAGFTLISEALYLGKPYLAYPMSGQYEQRLNAFQLQASGFGRSGLRAEDRNTIAAFLYDRPAIAETLAAIDRDHQDSIRDKLLELVANEASLAAKFRRRRVDG